MALGDVSSVKALVFDVGGSVFDWQTAVYDAMDALPPDSLGDIDRKALAYAWRARSFEELAASEGAAAESGRPPAPFSQFLAQSLDHCLSERSLNLPLEQRQSLVQAWQAMPCWEDFPDALARLKTRYMVAPLTILSMRIAVGSSRRCGLIWDAIFTCNLIGRYKPHPAAYHRAAELLELERHEVMMVAAHPSDLLAAQSAGLKTGYVEPRIPEPGEEAFEGQHFDDTFDLVAEDFTRFANKMGV